MRWLKVEVTHYSYWCRSCFHQATGFSVYKLIYNLRIKGKRAQQLLETDKTVFEIALDFVLEDGKKYFPDFYRNQRMHTARIQKKIPSQEVNP